MAAETMPNWLTKRAHLTPNRIALQNECGEEITFLKLFEESVKLANYFASCGIKKNDHVALLLSNTSKSVLAIHALQHIGAIMVFLNTRLSKHEQEWQINDATITYLLHEEAFEERANTISTNIKNLTCISLNKISDTNVIAPIQIDFNLNDVHSIMYTSGTTGSPKGVQITYSNHWWSAIGSSLNLGLHIEDKWLCCLPIFHVSGLSILMRSVIYGIPVVLYEAFKPDQIIKGMDDYNVTIISVVSAQLQKLLLPDKDHRLFPNSVRCVLLGGGPASESLLEECKERSIPVFQSYGMTETASQIITLSPEDMLRKSGSAGKALFPSQFKIVMDEKEMKPMEIGEIVVKGPTVTIGYYNREATTYEAFKDGWFYTGDLGFVDEEGFLFVVDRRNDLIISGGENIYPAEIEAVLEGHPQIVEAGVTGMTDLQWGKVPIAFIVKKGQATIREDAIITFCKERLANYKVPKQVHFVDSLPRNASNKLVRRKLVDSME